MWFVKILKFGPPKYFEWDLQLIYENIFHRYLSLGSYFPPVGTLGCLILLFVSDYESLQGYFLESFAESFPQIIFHYIS